LCRAGHVVHEAVEDRLDYRPVLPVVADLRVERADVVLERDDGAAALLLGECEHAGTEETNGEERDEPPGGSTKWRTRRGLLVLDYRLHLAFLSRGEAHVLPVTRPSGA